jgi:hypothetical protein
VFAVDLLSTAYRLTAGALSVFAVDLLSTVYRLTAGGLTVFADTHTMSIRTRTTAYLSSRRESRRSRRA